MLNFVCNFFHFLFGAHVFVQQKLFVFLQNRLVFSNQLVHKRLSHLTRVNFIVTMTTVTNQIDDEVLLEYLSELSSHLKDMYNSFDIISIDVDNRGIHVLCHISGVRGRASISRVSGETNLVVDNNVDTSSSCVFRQIIQVKRLINNTLSSKSSITVHQQGANMLSCVITTGILPGTSTSTNNRVDGLKMRGVSSKRQTDFFSSIGVTDVASTQMILDITSSRTLFKRILSLKLTKDSSKRLSNDISQSVQSTSMRHTNQHLLTAMMSGSVNQSFNTRNESFTTLQTKTFSSSILGRKEVFKQVSPGQPIVNHHSFCFIEFRERIFHFFSQKVDHFSVVDVGELNTNLSTVGFFQFSQNFSSSGTSTSSHAQERRTTSNRNFHIHLSLSETPIFWVQIQRNEARLQVFFLPSVEGVKVCLDVSISPVGTNKAEQAKRSVDFPGSSLSGSSTRSSSNRSSSNSSTNGDFDVLIHSQVVGN
mmetsp:Transcript_39817/g.62933  ORF Transcript_39817/g.62933 Transcript_39817/m.62933 type:complete len:479 (-) Transcript_39817:382-1818(-)